MRVSMLRALVRTYVMNERDENIDDMTCRAYGHGGTVCGDICFDAATSKLVHFVIHGSSLRIEGHRDERYLDLSRREPCTMKRTDLITGGNLTNGSPLSSFIYDSISISGFSAR
jgi:hypothetical protein